MNKPMPLVSVLMPAYNAENYLAEAIESVLNQSYRNFELLIINDGSTDRTEEIILSYEDDRIRYIKNETNLRLVRTLNKGLALSRGDYIARMDADDICYPNRLEVQVSFMEEHPEIGIAGSWFEYLENGKISKAEPPVEDHDIRALMVMATTLHHPTVIIRASLLSHPKLDFRYDQEFEHVEDYHLWVRSAPFTKFGNIPHVLLKYRVHPDSICKQKGREQFLAFDRIRKLSFPTFLEISYEDKLIALKNLDRKVEGRADYKYVMQQLKIIAQAIAKKGFNKNLIDKRIARQLYSFFHNNPQMGSMNIYYFFLSGIYFHLPFKEYRSNYIKLIMKSTLPFLFKR